MERIMTPKFANVKAESKKGSVRLNDPMKDLNKGAFNGTKTNGGFYGPNGPRKFGPLGELAGSAVKDKITNLRQTTARDEEIFTTEPMANTKHYHNRLVQPIAPDISTVSRGELCYMHLDDKKSHRVIQLEEMQLQANPRTVVNTAQWNAIVVDQQLQLFEKDPDAFAKLTPRDVFNSWSFEGVVDVDGGAGLDIRTQSRSNKRCTMNSKGQVMVHPFWKNVIAGSKCYIVIKRYAFRPNFVLNTKYSGNGISGQRHLVTKNQVPIRPIQIGFYSLSEGGGIPMEVYQSQDEAGYTYSDALVMFVGTVLRQPDGVATYDQSFVPHDDENMDHGHAYVDSNENLSRANLSMLTLILDCDEGVMPY